MPSGQEDGTATDASVERRSVLADDTQVYPSGLTLDQANEIQQGLMWGTRIYAGIAVCAHVLAFMLTPWLHL